MQKSCSRCSKAAQYSINVIVSTLGISRRLQQSSPALLLCDACIQKENDRVHASALRKLVNNAYTTLKERFQERSIAEDASRG
jgi:hypothetical protein